MNKINIKKIELDDLTEDLINIFLQDVAKKILEFKDKSDIAMGCLLNKIIEFYLFLGMDKEDLKKHISKIIEKNHEEKNDSTKQ